MSKYPLTGFVLMMLLIYLACNDSTKGKSSAPDRSLCHVLEHSPNLLTMYQIDSIVIHDNNIDSTCLYMAIQYLIEHGNYMSAVNLSYKLPSKNWITWARRIDAFQGMGNMDSSLYYCRLWLSQNRRNDSPDTVWALNAIGQVYDDFQWFDSALVYYQDVATLYSIDSPHELEPENTHFKVFLCFFRIGRKEDGIQYLKANSPQLINKYELNGW
jgi:hypothetical protein